METHLLSFRVYLTSLNVTISGWIRFLTNNFLTKDCIFPLWVSTLSVWRAGAVARGSAHAEFRQLVGVRSLLSSRGFLGQTQAFWLGSKCLCLWSHLGSPVSVFIHCSTYVPQAAQWGCSVMATVDGTAVRSTGVWVSLSCAHFGPLWYMHRNDQTDSVLAVFFIFLFLRKLQLICIAPDWISIPTNSFFFLFQMCWRIL